MGSNRISSKILALVILILTLAVSCTNNETIIEKENVNIEQTTYDLIVVGGEPEGIAAAVSATRNGLDTLLIEDGEALGGLMTLGRLNFLDMNYGPEKELLTRGIFEEFFEEMGNAYDVEEAKKYFLSLVSQEERITLKLNTKFTAPIKEGNRIVGVTVQDEAGEKKYYSKRLIDSTTDADVAAAAGAPYTVGAEDYGEKDKLMGVTLVFRVKGLNWPYIFLYNNFSRLASKVKAEWGDPYAGATWKVAWGYGEQALKYKPKDEMMRYRGPNLARQKDGTVLINALLIFGVDGLDPESRTKGIERGKEEIPHILAFMRKNFPGFKNVELVDVAEELYVRETRHIQGEYRLTIDDLLENRDQWDRIAYGSYPVDLQPAGPEDLGNVIGKPATYSVPFRSIVPLEVDNLLVASRSASYDSLPHGSTRVIPVGMAVGEAAGVAAAHSIENNLGFREISKSREAVTKIQGILNNQGAYLEEYEPPRPQVMDHWAYPGMKVMRSLGLAAGGYSNDYRLDDAIHNWDANYMISKVIQRADYFQGDVSAKPVEYAPGLTRQVLLIGTAKSLTGKELPLEDAVKLLKDKGIFTNELEGHMKDLKGTPTFGELYSLMAHYYSYLRK